MTFELWFFLLPNLITHFFSLSPGKETRERYLFSLLSWKVEKGRGIQHYWHNWRVFITASYCSATLSAYTVDLHPSLAFDLSYLGDLASWTFLRKVNVVLSWPVEYLMTWISFQHSPEWDLLHFIEADTYPVTKEVRHYLFEGFVRNLYFFEAINSPNNSPFAHSVLPVLSLSHRSFQGSRYNP